MGYAYFHSSLHGTPSTETCIPIQRHNTTLITDAYAGIPENLLLNCIGFLLLVILFGLLRKKAWNYGRLALLNKTDERWMELFYGDNEGRDTDAMCIETSVNSHLSQVDRGFLSWIVTAFKVTDDELLKRAGPDGLLYISFERHLIILTCLMLIVSLCIALPINFHGNMQDDNATFGHTTLSNLDPTSTWIWVHTVLLLSYLPIGGYIMRHFLKKVRDSRHGGELAARTLLITEIPKHQCNVQMLADYFKQTVPTLTVEDVTLAYDIRRLSALNIEKDCAEQARLYCENYARRREPLKMYPYPCGQIIGCCCKNQIDAQTFYANEEMRLTELVEEEKKVALNRPLGVAFVTLGTPGAAKVMKKHLCSLPSIKWVVDYAPTPSDIFWENLSVARPCWYLNAVLINFALGIVLFFLTTPAVDRHNLCFAYGPSIGGGQLAGAAASATGAAPILAQAALLALGLVRRGLSPLAAVQLSGLAASILGLVTGATLPASKSKIQTQKRDLSTGQNFVAPVLRQKQTSLEEIISADLNSDLTLPDSINTSPSVQESPKLYQNYGKESQA
ncbi:unnamed protein product [Xylocopa violacea]|uniref:CSC1-like protein 2 n=1 Tax=Xylocopa violacea TaxID=135666 RepID=A0ABP1N5I0_XYLVO